MPTKTSGDLAFPEVLCIEPRIPNPKAKPVELQYMLVPKGGPGFTDAHARKLQELLGEKIGRNSHAIVTLHRRGHALVRSQPLEKFEHEHIYPLFTALMEILKPKMKFSAVGLVVLPDRGDPTHETWIAVNMVGNHEVRRLNALRRKLRNAKGVVESLPARNDLATTHVKLRGDIGAAEKALTTALRTEGICIKVMIVES